MWNFVTFSAQCAIRLSSTHPMGWLLLSEESAIFLLLFGIAPLSPSGASSETWQLAA